MAPRNSENLRSFLGRSRDRDRDDEPEEPRGRGRGREDDDEPAPDSERRPARGRSRDDDDDDRPARRSRDDDDDRPAGNSRRNHTPKAGRFTGVPSDEGRPPQLEDGKHLLQIVKTFESENPKTGCWFQLQFEVLDSTNRKHRPGDTVSFRYHTERKSLTVTQGKIVGFTRAACGFKTDEDLRKRVPGMSASGKAPYSVLVDAALGVDEKVDYGGKRFNPSDEFGVNPLEGRVLIADVSKGKYDEEKDRQYYESEWSPCDQKLESLEDDDRAPKRSRNGRETEEEDRPARSARGAREGARPSRGRSSRDSDPSDEPPRRDAESRRGPRSEETEDDDRGRGRGRDADDEEEEERPRARSRR